MLEKKPQLIVDGIAGPLTGQAMAEFWKRHAPPRHPLNLAGVLQLLAKLSAARKSPRSAAFFSGGYPGKPDAALGYAKTLRDLEPENPQYASMVQELERGRR